jgi:hypothetical protein
MKPKSSRKSSGNAFSLSSTLSPFTLYPLPLLSLAFFSRSRSLLLARSLALARSHMYCVCASRKHAEKRELAFGRQGHSQVPQGKLNKLPDVSASSSGKHVIVACILSCKNRIAFLRCSIITLIFKLSSFRSISISEIRISYQHLPSCLSFSLALSVLFLAHFPNSQSTFI